MQYVARYRTKPCFMSPYVYSSHLDILTSNNAACAGCHKPPTSARPAQRKRPSGGVLGEGIIGLTSAEVVFCGSLGKTRESDFRDLAARLWRWLLLCPTTFTQDKFGRGHPTAIVIAAALIAFTDHSLLLHHDLLSIHGVALRSGRLR